MCDGPGREGPGVEDELRITVIGEDATKQFAGNQVANSTRFRFREGMWSYIGFIAGDMTGGIDVQGAPHIPIVPVGVDAHAAIGVPPPVLAPQPILSTRVFMAIRVDHGRHPDLPLAQPLLDRGLVSMLNEILG